MTVKSEEVQSTKKKVEQLHKLLNAASSEAERYGKQRGYDTGYCSRDEDYLEYRNLCFEKIEGTWWKIARPLGISLWEYAGYDNVEQEMRGCLNDYERDKPDWLLDVLEEIEEEE